MNIKMKSKLNISFIYFTIILYEINKSQISCREIILNISNYWKSNEIAEMLFNMIKQQHFCLII